MAYIGPKLKPGAMLKDKTGKDTRARGKSEDSIQGACENILNDIGIRFIHIPDIVYRMCSPISRLKVWEKSTISKYLKGIPDLVLFLRDGRYICIELKRTDGKQKQGQKTFEKQVGSENYHLCRSVEGFLEVMQKYGVVEL